MLIPILSRLVNLVMIFLIMSAIMSTKFRGIDRSRQENEAARLSKRKGPSMGSLGIRGIDVRS